ncbi:MAG: phosphate ABC transporter permease subunit PstC, partial [Gammaproteobacteria bacterium]|nr:phosphate ABC transporter permease subunit PstC [Gammaproteobacteria bacterium]
MYRLSDRFFTLTLWTGGLTGIIAVFLILCFLVVESIPALNTIGIVKFFSDPAWHPLENEYNLLPMLLGSVFITTGAVILSLPLALGSAVYLVFFLNPQFHTFTLRILEVLGGIPSVIFGLWGMVTVVPLIAKIDGPGTSLLAGSIVVAMMILPALVL